MGLLCYNCQLLMGYGLEDSTRSGVGVSVRVYVCVCVRVSVSVCVCLIVSGLAGVKHDAFLPIFLFLCRATLKKDTFVALSPFFPFESKKKKERCEN